MKLTTKQTDSTGEEIIRQISSSNQHTCILLAFLKELKMKYNLIEKGNHSKESK